MDLDYSKIRGLHIELTTKCNARCPMCARNYKGKTRDNLPLVELNLEKCRKILTADFLKQIELISICGVFGDPINATELPEIIQYIYDCNKCVNIDIYTNGSIHDVEWWSNLARILINGRVVFGIDGVGKTSSIHRKGTNYKKVIRNAQAFITAGGKAKWDFIVFKHNEDEVAEASLLSKKLGFETFEIKKTSRFFKNLYEKDPLLDSTIMKYGKHPVFDETGKLERCLELPQSNEYINNAEKKLFELIEEYGCLNDYFDGAKIECNAVKTRGVFISAFGDVYPCCTVYQQVCYGSVFGVTEESELNEYRISKSYDLSALNKTIKDVVEGGFFEAIEKSWKCGSVAQGKAKACCRTCGNLVDIHAAQHTKSILA